MKAPHQFAGGVVEAFQRPDTQQAGGMDDRVRNRQVGQQRVQGRGVGEIDGDVAIARADGPRRAAAESGDLPPPGEQGLRDAEADARAAAGYQGVWHLRMPGSAGR